MRKLLIILAVLASAIPSGASIANIYYAQTAAGSNNGTDCADAYAYNDATNGFNTAGKWGAGSTQIGQDTIAHACGTFTGMAGSSLFVFQGSGASGHPITLRGESGVDMTAPYWGGGSTGGPIWAVSRSWLNIDCPSLACTIENTQNGTGLTFAVNSYGININGSSNVTVKQWTVANICQHTSLADNVGCQTSGSNDCAVCVGSGSTNITITQMTIHDSFQCVLYAPANADSGITVSNNTLSRCNWGVSSGITSGTSNGLLITGNDITCVIGATCNWDTTVGTCCHHNGIILDPQSGGVMDGVVISDNYIHDEIGESTGGVFLDPDALNEITSILIYNNVFFTTTGQQGPSNGHIACGNFVAGCQEYNNTMVGPATNGLTGQLTPTFANNIVESVGFAISLGSGYTTPSSDYGDFFNIASGYAASGLAGSPFSTLSAWVTAISLDTHSITTNPNLTTSLVPNSGSPVLLAGTNLTSLGIAALDVGAPQTFGVSGSCGTGCLPRPTIGSWDMGAYQVSSLAPVSGGGSIISGGVKLSGGARIQ